MGEGRLLRAFGQTLQKIITPSGDDLVGVTGYVRRQEIDEPPPYLVTTGGTEVLQAVARAVDPYW